MRSLSHTIRWIASLSILLTVAAEIGSAQSLGDASQIQLSRAELEELLARG